jgi:hypothetical protein
LENQKSKEKLLSFLQQKVCFSFPFLANFHSSSFYEREKTKRPKSTKDKSDDDPWGRRMGERLL